MSFPTFEALESRQFFAAQMVPTFIPPVIGPVSADHASASAASTSTSQAVVNRTSKSSTILTTDLTGTWDGQIKVKLLFWKVKYDVVLRIEEQTSRTLYGSITIDGHELEGTFVGKIRSNGKFSYKLRHDGGYAKIEGRITPHGTILIGKIKADYRGWYFKGDYRLDRPEAPASAVV